MIGTKTAVAALLLYRIEGLRRHPIPPPSPPREFRCFQAKKSLPRASGFHFRPALRGTRAERKTPGRRNDPARTPFKSYGNTATSKSPGRNAQTLFGQRTKEASFFVLRRRFALRRSPYRISDSQAEELNDRIFICLVRASNMDGGQSMTPGSILSLMLFALALAGVVRASDLQIQQSCMNVAVCALAVRSGFLADRRSDFQIRHVSLFASDQRSLGSDIVNPSLS